MASLIKKRILLIAANSMDTQALSLPKEFRDIEEGIELAKKGDLFSIKQVGATRYKDLRRKLLQYQPNIVHFSGHGSSNGLFLEDDSGRAKKASKERLVDLLDKFSDQIECVILNACDSEAIAEGLSKSIPYAIGMSAPISDPSAIEFSTGFYDAIGNGRGYEDAFDFGLNAISSTGSSSHRSFDLSESEEHASSRAIAPPILFSNSVLVQRLDNHKNQASSPTPKKQEEKSKSKLLPIAVVGALVLGAGMIVMNQNNTSNEAEVPTIKPFFGGVDSEGLRSCRGEKTGALSIIKAAGRGVEKVVDDCLALGIDINLKDVNGWTALHAASQNGRAKIARKLVDKGADINAVTNNGETALSLAKSIEIKGLLDPTILSQCQGKRQADVSIIKAAGRGILQTVDDCLALGVDINLKDGNGWNALHAASQFDHEKVARKLVAKGINIDATTNHGETALFLAVAQENFQVVDYLLKSGADKNKGTNEGVLPIAIAKTTGMKDLLNNY